MTPPGAGDGGGAAAAPAYWQGEGDQPRSHTGDQADRRTDPPAEFSRVQGSSPDTVGFQQPVHRTLSRTCDRQVDLEYGSGSSYGPRGVNRPVPVARGERAKGAAVLVTGWVALLCLLEAIDAASGYTPDTFGISPCAVG